MKPVPSSAIFVEDDGVVYFVTNWKQRRTATTKALLIKLSKPHLLRYRHMKAKGRSQKSIYYYVFGVVTKRRPVAATRAEPAPARPARSGATDIFVSVPLGLLNTEQLLGLIQVKVGKSIPGLRDAPIADLRKLFIALGGGSRTAPAAG